MIYLTRKERFSAAHRMFRKEWSMEKNQEVFGKCTNPNWHGHDYELFVTIKGRANQKTGYIIDLKLLSSIIHKRVIEKCDHKNLNLEVDFMKEILPSGEDIVVAIWKQLFEPVKALGCDLHSIKLCETDNNIIEYFGK